MPKTLIFYTSGLPVEVARDGKWQQFFFSVSLEQLEHQIPSVYARLIAKGADFGKIMITHASDSGNIELPNLEAVRAYQPDALFVCHPGDARNVYPDLPIQGYFHDPTKFFGSVGSPVVSIELS